jgi:hypothetical protein
VCGTWAQPGTAPWRLDDAALSQHTGTLATAGAGQPGRDRFRLAPDPQDVAAGQGAAVGVAAATAAQFRDQVRVAGDILQADRDLVSAVVVTAQPDVGHARYRTNAGTNVTMHTPPAPDSRSSISSVAGAARREPQQSRAAVRLLVMSPSVRTGRWRQRGRRWL